MYSARTNVENNFWCLLSFVSSRYLGNLRQLACMFNGFGSGGAGAGTHAATLTLPRNTSKRCRSRASDDLSSTNRPQISNMRCFCVASQPRSHEQVGPKPATAKHGGSASQLAHTSTHQLSVTSLPVSFTSGQPHPSQPTADCTKINPAIAPTT